MEGVRWALDCPAAAMMASRLLMSPVHIGGIRFFPLSLEELDLQLLPGLGAVVQLEIVVVLVTTPVG